MDWSAAGGLQPGEGAGLGWKVHRPEPDGESGLDASCRAGEGAWEADGGLFGRLATTCFSDAALVPGLEHEIDAFVDGHAGVVEQDRILCRLQGRDGAILVALVPHP